MMKMNMLSMDNEYSVKYVEKNSMANFEEWRNHV